MTTVGIFSDTHGYLDPDIWRHFADVDLIIHAGDIGTIDTVEEILKFKPTKIVFGNADPRDLSLKLKEYEIFQIESFKILLIHIAISKQELLPKVQKLVLDHQVNWVVFGHTHMPMFTHSKALPEVLMINPGAAGKQGFHKKRTMLKFTIDQNTFLKKEVIELIKAM